MVHGTGSFGGGGGGFSGSGGVSSTSTTHFSHHYSSSCHYSSSSHGQGDESCDCSWIRVCFCCRGKSFKVRVLILWMWIVAITLMTSLITVFSVNKTHKIEATITDMRKVPKRISETFCEGVSITSSSSEFTAWLFDGQPAVDVNDLQHVTFRKKTQIAYNNYEYWGFYLLANSVIQISSCPDSVIQFTIVQGHKNFEQFKTGDCLDSCSVFSGTTYCFNDKPKRYHYKVQADEEYYLIFLNRALQFPTNVAVNFTFEKRLYNLEDSLSECSNSPSSSSCTLHFPSLNFHPSIILNVTSSSDLEGDAEIDVSCISRKWVYVMIFFIVPLVLGTLGTALLVKKYRKNPRQTPTSTPSSAPFSALPPVLEESESASPQAPGSKYGAVVQPPKYQDTTGRPPSYEEATK